MSLGVLMLLVEVIESGIISPQGNTYWHMYRCENREKKLVNHIQINNLNDKYDGICIFWRLMPLAQKIPYSNPLRLQSFNDCCTDQTFNLPNLRQNKFTFCLELQMFQRLSVFPRNFKSTFYCDSVQLIWRIFVIFCKTKGDNYFVHWMIIKGYGLCFFRYSP